jgi:hypothetical protein
MAGRSQIEDGKTPVPEGAEGLAACVNERLKSGIVRTTMGERVRHPADGGKVFAGAKDAVYSAHFLSLPSDAVRLRQLPAECGIAEGNPRS